MLDIRYEFSVLWCILCYFVSSSRCPSSLAHMDPNLSVEKPDLNEMQPKTQLIKVKHALKDCLKLSRSNWTSNILPRNVFAVSNPISSPVAVTQL